MGPQEDNLFGRIVLKQGYVKQAQLDECLVIQREASRSRLLGKILIEKGYLTKEQLRKVMIIQKQTMALPAKDEVERQADVSFGYIAVQRGLVTSDQVYECVREQVRMARKGLYFRLGEVFINAGHLTPEQVEVILGHQYDCLLNCPGCGIRYNVLRYPPGKKVRCRNCKTLIEIPERALAE